MSLLGGLIAYTKINDQFEANNQLENASMASFSQLIELILAASSD